MTRGLKAMALVMGILAVAANVSSAQAVTGQELLRQCEALERGALVSGETVRLPKSQDAATCWVYTMRTAALSLRTNASTTRLFAPA